MLTRLMRKLKPNEIEERYKTLQELTKHCSGPPVNESKSKWLNKWPEIISVYKAANLPDVEGNRPTRLFLTSIQRLDYGYATPDLTRTN
jgi:hypothetical protein